MNRYYGNLNKAHFLKTNTWTKRRINVYINKILMIPQKCAFYIKPGKVNNQKLITSTVGTASRETAC